MILWRFLKFIKGKYAKYTKINVNGKLFIVK